MSVYMSQKSYNKPSLPPLASLLKDQNYKLPSIETFYDKNGVSAMPTPISTVSTPGGGNGSTTGPVGIGMGGPQYRDQVPQFQGGVGVGAAPVAPAPVAPAAAAAAPISRTSSTSSSTGTSPTTPEFKKNKKLDKSFAFISHSVKTFPSQEPSIDNAPLARRKRRRTSPNELNILNQEFLLGSTPNKLRRMEIANKVSMTEKAVQIWFQNKRQSLRKQGSGDKEITELPPTPENISMNSSFNSSMNSSMNNSMNNSAINLNTSLASINTSVISSTPVKPSLNKSQSFTSPDIHKVESPIKQRAASTTSIHTNKSIISSRPDLSSSTPDSSFIDDSDSSLSLNEPKRKQHHQLQQPILSANLSNSSSMTFKFKVHNDNKENMSVKPQNKSNHIRNLLNDVADEPRKPLGEINSNNSNKVSGKPRINEGVQNLLSLREGNWR